MIIYTCKEKRETTQIKLGGNKKMIKVTGLNELAEIIEENNRIEKAEREIKKERVKELKSQGIDPEIAKVMADLGL